MRPWPLSRSTSIRPGPFQRFEGRLDIGLQGRLIAFDGEQIILGVADGLGDVRMQAIASIVTKAPSRLRPAASFSSSRGMTAVRWFCRRPLPVRDPDGCSWRRLKTRCSAPVP